MTPEKLKSIIEAALLASERPLSADRILGLFQADAGHGCTQVPTRQDIKEALATLQAECENRGLELIEVSSGYRYQVRQSYGEWINRMFEERAPRYSRALLETLALICYKQPITRAEIEDVRGVAVSTNIIRTLLDREWIKLVGHRDVPGKPALYGTTRKLLDDLSLKKLDELPPLAEIRDIEKMPGELDLIAPNENGTEAGDESEADADVSMSESGGSVAALAVATASDGAESVQDSSKDSSNNNDNASESRAGISAGTDEEPVLSDNENERSLARAATS